MLLLIRFLKYWGEKKNQQEGQEKKKRKENMTQLSISQYITKSNPSNPLMYSKQLAAALVAF